MTNVSRLPATTSMSVEQALNYALGDGLKEVLIIGLDEEGSIVIRSSRITRRDALWLAKQAELNAVGADDIY